MSQIFVGRQPILDQNLDLYAYELLFRDGRNNGFTEGVDPDVATSEVLTVAFTDIGLEEIVGSHLVFINTTYKFITTPDLLPITPEQVVLEVLEDTPIDEHSIAGIEDLHNRGFVLALDDFLYDEKYEAVFKYIDIVKLDITLLDPSTWSDAVSLLKQRGLKVLAEKVETQEEYDQLKTYGVDYYQGYFFARPSVISGQRITPNNIVIIQLLAKVNNSATSLKELQELIIKDVGVTVKVLTYVNSSSSGVSCKVESIKEAIVLLGRDIIKRWVTMFALSSAGDAPNELIATALIRAKFCELLAEASDDSDSDSFFTVGLFSILDALLNADLESILKPIPISQEMRSALLEHTGKKGQALNCAISTIEGDFDCDFFNLEKASINSIYLEAVNWADTAMKDLRLR